MQNPPHVILTEKLKVHQFDGKKQGLHWKFHKNSLFSKLYRNQLFRHTVWKSTLKRYHDEKNSVKTHNKNLQNLILQMDDFVHSVNFTKYFSSFSESVVNNCMIV